MKNVLWKSTLVGLVGIVFGAGCSSIDCGSAKVVDNGDIVVVIEQEPGGGLGGFARGAIGRVTGIKMGKKSGSGTARMDKDELLKTITPSLQELAARKSKDGCKECPTVQCETGDKHCKLSYEISNTDDVQVETTNINVNGVNKIRYTITIPAKSIKWKCSVCTEESCGVQKDQKTSNVEDVGGAAGSAGEDIQASAVVARPDGRVRYEAPRGANQPVLSLSLTYAGDANGDGLVDFKDLQAFDDGGVFCRGAITQFESRAQLERHIVGMVNSRTNVDYAKRGGFAGCAEYEQEIYSNLR